MSVFVDGIEVTVEYLNIILNELKDGEVLELIEVDEHGNLYLEIGKYGIYY